MLALLLRALRLGWAAVLQVMKYVQMRWTGAASDEVRVSGAVTSDHFVAMCTICVALVRVLLSLCAD